MNNKILVLSIHQSFADKIFNGTKKVELRRTRPKVAPDDLVLVYVSSPVKAMEGTFRIKRIMEGTPGTIWKKVRSKAGITKQQFDDYYSGAARAFAIFLELANRLPQPIHLYLLRQVLRSFRPPQSYVYINKLALDEIVRFSHALKKRELLRLLPN